MTNLSYDQLSKSDFQRAVQKLCSLPMRTPEAFKLKHLWASYQKEVDNMHDVFKKEIMAAYAVGGEKCNTPPSQASREHKLPFDCIAGKEAEAAEKIKEFGKRQTALNCKKLSGEFVLSLGEWSGAELCALDPILVELVAVE